MRTGAQLFPSRSGPQRTAALAQAVYKDMEASGGRSIMGSISYLVTEEAIITIQFSQQGMAALPLNVRRGQSSFVRRLVNTRNDPAKACIRA